MLSIKNLIIAKKRTFLILIVFSTLCFSSDISVENLSEVISGENPQLKGFIQNLQIAPFNKDLVSFEVENDNDPTIKLFLYNLETKNLLQIESANFSGDEKTRRRYYLKDQGLRWHPYKNWFVFYGNAYGDREQIYICRVIVPELINNFAVNGYHVILRENLKEERSYVQDPVFDMTGENIFFTRRLEKRDRNAKYNKTFNITGIIDIFKYRDNKFRGVEFKTVIDKQYNQFKPLPSPLDKDIIAYISYKNQEKRGEDYYAEYSLNLLNLRNSDITVVDNMDGYQDYPFFWSNTGSYLYYFKAVSLLRTPQKWIDDKINIVHLYFTKIEKAGNSLSSITQTNPKTDILLEDVVPKQHSISFINDNNFIIAKYDPYASLFLVDVNLWRSLDGKYAKKIEFEKDFDTEFPALSESDLYFVSLAYLKTKTISAIQSSKASITLSGGEVRDIASQQGQMDKEEISGTDDDKYYEEETFDDTDVYETPVVSSAEIEKLAKITELEKKLNELQVEKLKIDNDILSEQNNLEKLESDIRNMTKQSTDLLDSKSSALANISEIRLKQTQGIERQRQLALKESELVAANNEKLKIENEILQLENSILTENDAIASIEKDLDQKNEQVAELRNKLSSLRIEQTRKTMEAENMLSVFQSQLADLKNNSASIQTQIEQTALDLAESKQELKSFEEQLAVKESEKEKLAESVSKLKSDKLLSMQQDKEAQLKNMENSLSSLKADLSKISSEIEGLTASVEAENNSVAAMIGEVKNLNNDKITALNKLTELRAQRTDSEKEKAAVVVEEKPEEKTPADDEYADEDEYQDEYADEDEYGDDSVIDEDVFEDVQTSSSRRRGRR
ncbi:MAG: hypothetical protein JXN63_00855 [Candidatus Delongbacteria bacterium]|nr:hypothetical protein [Candidatus Delongbacteria bacterium]